MNGNCKDDSNRIKTINRFKAEHQKLKKQEAEKKDKKKTGK